MASSAPYILLPSRPAGGEATRKLALFDIDGTLLISRSGRRWAASAADSLLAFPNVAEVLQARRTDGWTIALISNQSQAHKDPGCLEKIEWLLVQLEATNGWRPITLVATGKSKKNDRYRKPARGLYDVLISHLGLKAAEVEALTMCGDAAGAEDPHPPYRWSDSDRGFANRIGAVFERPMDVFGIPVPPTPTPPSQSEMVLLVGNPGSGKTTTAHRFKEAGYLHIEQDILRGARDLSVAEQSSARDMLGSKNHTLKFAKTVLANGEGRRMIVDATHGSAANRAPYEELARSVGIPLRILWHVTNGRPFNGLRAQPVPEVAYAVYRKHFVEPVGAEKVYI